jgi:hypothetical protein
MATGAGPIITTNMSELNKKVHTGTVSTTLNVAFNEPLPVEYIGVWCALSIV